MTREQIERREFSFAQAFYSEPYACHKFLVGSPSRPVAKSQAEQYATEQWGAPRKVLVYPRTYVANARVLFAEGRYAS